MYYPADSNACAKKMSDPQVGGLVSAAPICWLSGARRLVAGFGNALRVYEIKDDGQPRPSAMFHGHESRVVAMVAAGPMRVTSAAKDGTVQVWDVEDGTLLRTIDCGRPIVDMVALFDGRVVVATATDVFVLLLERLSDDSSSVVMRVNSGLSRSSDRRVSASANGSVIASVGCNTLTIAFVDGEDVKSVQIHLKRRLTAVSVSEDGTSLAAGNDAGVIFVFRNLDDVNKTGRIRYMDQGLKYSNLHWHSHSVLSLRFSKYSNILYSGGCEGVLVVWNMTKTDFGRRNFKPRLGGAIWGISPTEDDALVALTHADNAVRILETVGMNVTATLRGICTAHLRSLPPWDVAERQKQARHLIHMTSEPGNSGCAIIAGMGNAVQLYDVFRGLHVSDMQIVSRNTVMGGKDVEDKADIELSQTVRHITVSADMKYMASVTQDVHPLSESKTFDKNIFLETLKFWDYGGGSGKIKLISRLDEPHGPKGTMTSIAFHPSLPVLATASTCGKFKLWRAVSIGNNSNDHVWRCELTEQYRNAPCGQLAFSADGSILAVSNESSISLWCVENFSDILSYEKAESGLISLDANCSIKVSFLFVLVHPPAEETIGHLSFVKENSPYLLATTRNGLYLWNILERRIWWSTRIFNRPECTVSDPSSGRFALVVKFESDSPQLTFTNELGPLEHANERPTPKKANTKATPRFRRSSGKTSQKKKVAETKTPQSTPSNPKRQRPELPMDTAVALFNVSSPVPMSVSRLPVGTDVAGISFVCDARNNRGASKSVFCFDTNMEIVPVPCSSDVENISDVTAPDDADDMAKTKSLPGRTNLEDLVGADWRDHRNIMDVDRVNNASQEELPSTRAEITSIRNILGKYLDASGVIQPSIANVAVPLLRELANVVHANIEKSEKLGNTSHDQTLTESPIPIETKGVDGAISCTKASDTQAEIPDADLLAMSSFLGSLRA